MNRNYYCSDFRHFKAYLLSTLILIFVFTVASTAEAVVFVSKAVDVSQTGFPVANDDLINSGSPALSSVSQLGFVDGRGSSAAGLNDGSVGTSAVLDSRVASSLVSTWTSTYTLNTATNTSGYDIDSIVVTAGWQTPFAGQSWSVAFSTVENPALFSAPEAYSLVPPPEAGASRIQLLSAIDPIAAHVKAIRFEFATDYVFREVDVFGNASPTPEPSSIALLGMGAAGLIGPMLRRRRKR